MFENKIIKGEYATLYIASWENMTGEHIIYAKSDDFQEWLESLGLNMDEIWHIMTLATCGKLELETSAKQFIKQKELERGKGS